MKTFDTIKENAKIANITAYVVPCTLTIWSNRSSDAIFPFIFPNLTNKITIHVTKQTSINAKTQVAILTQIIRLLAEAYAKFSYNYHASRAI
jgi:hypothetical protein